MKTYLISQEQIKQFVMLLVVAMLVVFFAGYYLGAQGAGHSTQFSQSADVANTVETGVLVNSPAGVKDNTETEKSGQNKATSKNQTTDTTDSKKADSNKKKAEQQAIEKQKAEKNRADREKAEKKIADKKKAEKKKTEKKKAEERARKEAAKKAQAQKDKAKKDKASKEAALTPSEKTQSLSASGSANTEKPADLKPGQRYYSIQAGMFASRVNASSFIDKLAEKGFKAYVSNFVSTSGAVKYNVRVGRFEKRDQARVLLREFQTHFSSPAYVVSVLIWMIPCGRVCRRLSMPSKRFITGWQRINHRSLRRIPRSSYVKSASSS